MSYAMQKSGAKSALITLPKMIAIAAATNRFALDKSVARK
jgi:hypothetical protein